MSTLQSCLSIVVFAVFSIVLAPSLLAIGLWGVLLWFIVTIFCAAFTSYMLYQLGYK